jgi:glycosyltransferase involved in cell wall biosynthesis
VTISVLIPVKGKAIYLEQALRSIERSNYLPNETLIIDDGIDKSVIDSIKNNFISINVKIIKNSGVGLVDALNTGIKASDNEYLARLDSDDLIENNRLQIQLNFLENNPDVAVVGSQVTYIDSSNKVLGYSRYPNGNLNSDPNFLKKCLLAHPSVLMRKTSVLKVDGYRETIRFGTISLCEDFDLWRRLGNVGGIVNLPNNLTRYRQHTTQLSTLNSSAQALATFILGSGFFDSRKTTIDIDSEDRKIEDSKIDEILKELSWKNKIILRGRAFVLKNGNESPKYSVLLSYLVEKITNLIYRFN